MGSKKRYKAAAEAVDRDRLYALEEAIDVIAAFPPIKFDRASRSYRNFLRYLPIQ